MVSSSLAEVEDGALTERGLVDFSIQAIKNHSPTPVHGRQNRHILIGHVERDLEKQRQRQALGANCSPTTTCRIHRT